METNFDNSPIEALGLEEETVKKLKQIFIYTVGQLQAKTEEALKESLIFHEDTMEVMIISNALVKKTGRGFAKEIEPQDQIEKIKKGIRNFRILKRSGLCRISELMRISKAELKTIIGIENTSCEKIEEKLREYYGEQYDTVKEQMVGKNPDAMSLGHLNISNDLFLHFRNGEIYTVGDYQQKVDSEILMINGLDGWYIEIVNQQLSERGIKRYKEGKEGIETLDLPPEIYLASKKQGKLRVNELLETTWEEAMEMYSNNREAIISILKAYMKKILLKNGKYNIITELETLKKITAVLRIIKQNKELQKRKLREIIELLEKNYK